MKHPALSLTVLFLPYLLCACQSPGARKRAPNRAPLVAEVASLCSKKQSEQAIARAEQALQESPWSAKDLQGLLEPLQSLEHPKALLLCLDIASRPPLILQESHRRRFGNWLSKRVQDSDLKNFAKRYDAALAFSLERAREDPEDVLFQRMNERVWPAPDDPGITALALTLRLELELLFKLKDSEVERLAPRLREILEDALRLCQDAPLRAFFIRAYGQLGAKVDELLKDPWRERILAATKEERGLARKECILAAGRLGGAALLERLEDDHDAWLQPALRLQATQALAFQSAETKVQELLQGRLNDWNEEVRRAAFLALLEEPSYPERRSLALRALDENDALAFAAVAVISSGTSTEEAAAVLRRFESAPPKDSIQKIKIFKLLANKGPVEFLPTALTWKLGAVDQYEALYQRAIAEKKIRAVLARCLAEDSERARLFALDKLFRRPPKETGFANEEVVKVAIYTVQRDPGRETVLSALLFLQGHGKSIEARDALYSVIEDHRLPSARLEALRTLSLFPSRESLEGIELAFKDLSPRVRAFAYQESARALHPLALALLFQNLKRYPGDEADLGDALFLLMESLAKTEKAGARFRRAQSQLIAWAQRDEPPVALFALKGLAATSKVAKLPPFEKAHIKELRRLLIIK